MSLLRTAARVGVATSVHGKVQRRQSQRWAQQDAAARAAQAAPPPPAAAPPPAAPVAPPAPAAPAAPPVGAERLTLLAQLGDLLSSGVLTQEEFEREKQRILA